MPARRLRPGERLVLATHNPGKVAELVDLLAPHGVAVEGAAKLGLPEPEETGTTFAANAALKAHAAAEAAGLPALADDSGLAVRALNGDPGVLSARWAGQDRDFGAAMARVLDALTDAPDRRAAFVCALCLAWPDGAEIAVEGRVEGTIAQAPRGEAGFGYDPIFLPQGERRTFAEMNREEKQRLSHRGRALRALIEAAVAR